MKTINNQMMIAVHGGASDSFMEKLTDKFLNKLLLDPAGKIWEGKVTGYFNEQTESMSEGQTFAVAFAGLLGSVALTTYLPSCFSSNS